MSTRSARAPPIILKGLQDFLGCLWEVLGDALEKRTHDILLVSALVKLRNVDPMFSTLTRTNSEAQNTLIHHPVKVHDDGGPGDRLTLTQFLVHVLLGLPSARAQRRCQDEAAYT